MSTDWSRCQLRLQQLFDSRTVTSQEVSLLFYIMQHSMHAHLLTCVRFLGRKSVLPCAACLRELVPTRVHVRSRPPLCACNSAKEFWTHVRSFHVLWGCRPRACSQHELKAQQGHLSLDSTPIVLSFLPAMFQRETLKRCEGRRKEQGRGHSLLSFTSARRYFNNDRSW